MRPRLELSLELSQLGGIGLGRPVNDLLQRKEDVSVGESLVSAHLADALNLNGGFA